MIERYDKRIREMKDLVGELNLYRDSYYNKNISLVTNEVYDEKFDKLVALEKETGVIFTNSPTQNVGFEVKSDLKKCVHSHKMLSLDKTKDTKALEEFVEKGDSVLSLKMDGLTVLVTYENGVLFKAETRGDGEIGEDITHNARVFANIPLTIPSMKHEEFEGEAIITYEDYERINKPLAEKALKEIENLGLTGDEADEYFFTHTYANPRNLVSGSVRQLDSKIAKERNIRFVLWKVPSGYSHCLDAFSHARNMGFEIVPHIVYTKNDDNIEECIEYLKRRAKEKSYPIDGLVITYEDMDFGKKLGRTEHHPLHSLAYKFYDDLYDTEMVDIDWTVGKDAITPTAVFRPVRIDGSTVRRASLHNISILESLGIHHKGQKIKVYKANQVIPQVASAEQLEEGVAYVFNSKDILQIPDRCPCCGEVTKIKQDNESKVLICPNPECEGKLISRLKQFVSKKAMNIDGLAEATLQFLIDKKKVRGFIDLYMLKHNGAFVEDWINTEGFGSESVKKILKAIEDSRNTRLDKFIYALCIPNIGTSKAKDIAQYCNYDIETFLQKAKRCDWTVIDGISDTIDFSINDYCQRNYGEIKELASFMTFEAVETKNASADLSGITFVITGKLETGSRDEIKEKIESLGGKVAGSVSAKTNYLVNNDIESTSGKNKKAKELGIPIISEKDLIEMFSGNK